MNCGSEWGGGVNEEKNENGEAYQNIHDKVSFESSTTVPVNVYVCNALCICSMYHYSNCIRVIVVFTSVYIYLINIL